MPKLILNPLSAKLDYVSTKADLDLSGTNSGDVTVTDTSTIDFTLTGQALTGSVIQSGITHNNLGGLTTGDPHTQYALLLGRSGGQTLIGGTAANDDLTLEGTSNATRTTSYVLLQPNGGNVGIGTTSPNRQLHVYGDTNTVMGMRLQQANAGTLAQVQNVLENNTGSLAYYGIASSNYTGFVPINGGKAFFGSNNTDTSIFTQSAHDINFYVNTSTLAMTIKSVGNIGIGTSSVNAQLDITRANDSGVILRIGNSSNAAFDFSRNSSTGALSIQGNQSGFNNILLCPTSGNVGIGTTSPEAKLQIFSSTVSDALMLSGSSLSNNARKFSGIIGKHYTNTEEPLGIIWYDSNVSSSEVNFGGGASILNAPTDIVFWAAANTTTTTGTEYLHIYGNGAKVIFPNGNVGINDTAPSAQLHVDQTSTTAAKPTLRLQQADLSEEFIRFDATVGTGNPINTTALGTYYGRVRVYVEGVGEKWLALYNT